jgi:hypothetical protein
LTAVSPASAYVSDTGRFREAAATPVIRLFEVAGSLGHARVVEGIRVLADEHALKKELAGLDARHEALILAGRDGPTAPPGSRSSRAEIVRAAGGTIEVRAEGPGLLVVAETWDAGWRARLDDRPARVWRTNDVQLGLPLPPGMHRVVLEYTPRGWPAGVALAMLSAGWLALGFRRLTASSSA